MKNKEELKEEVNTGKKELKNKMDAWNLKKQSLTD